MSDFKAIYNAPKSNFGWGSAADPVGGGGTYSAPPDPLA